MRLVVQAFLYKKIASPIACKTPLKKIFYYII